MGLAYVYSFTIDGRALLQLLDHLELNACMQILLGLHLENNFLLCDQLGSFLMLWMHQNLRLFDILQELIWADKKHWLVMLELLEMLHFVLRDRHDAPLARNLLIFTASLMRWASHARRHQLIVALSAVLELSIDRRMTLVKLHRLWCVRRFLKLWYSPEVLTRLWS